MISNQNDSFTLKTINNVKTGALILFIVPIIGILFNLIALQFLTALIEAIASFYFAYALYIFASDQNNVLKQEPMHIAIAFLILGIFQITGIFLSANTSAVTADITNQATATNILQAFNTLVIPTIILLVLQSIALLLGFIWFNQLFNRILSLYNMPESNNLMHAAILQAIGNGLVIISLIMLSSLVNQVVTSGISQNSLSSLSFIALLLIAAALLIIAAFIVQIVAWYKVYKRSDEIETFIQNPSGSIPSQIPGSSLGSANQSSYEQPPLQFVQTSHLQNINTQPQNENLSHPSQSMLEKPVFCSNCGAKLGCDSKFWT